MEDAKLSEERSSVREISAVERERIKGVLESVWAVRGDGIFPEVHFFRTSEFLEKLPGETYRASLHSFGGEWPIAQYAWTRAADDALQQHLFVNVDYVDHCEGEALMDSTRENSESWLRKLAVYQSIRHFGLVSPALSHKGRSEYQKIVEGWMDRLQTKHPWHYKKLITPRRAYGAGLDPATSEGREQIMQRYCNLLCMETVLQPAVKVTVDEIARLLSEDVPGVNWKYRTIEYILRIAAKTTVSRQED